MQDLISSSDPPFPTREFLGVSIAVATRAAAINFLLSRLAQRKQTAVAFANTNLLNKVHELGLANELSNRFVVFNDGVGLDLLSRFRYASPFPENLNGTDFTADLFSALPTGTRVFLFGAKPCVAKRAAEVLAEKYAARIVGRSHGFVSEEEARDLVGTINAALPDLVLVALGNPKQEQWILRHAPSLQAPLLLAVGAFLDFAAGAAPRAPVWLRAIRMEWLFRLVLEPSRLWRRYTLEIAVLLIALARSRKASRNSPSK